jgi:hypothetical protein
MPAYYTTTLDKGEGEGEGEGNNELGQEIGHPCNTEMGIVTSTCQSGKKGYNIAANGA